MSEAMFLTQRKALGAYYTPTDASHYMASWAMRRDSDVILEPSLGDGAFIAAAADVAASRGWPTPTFVAAELNPTAADEVMGRGWVTPEEVWLGDFLAAPIRPADAAIGNPPYVRVRALPKEQAKTAVEASRQDLGVPMRESGSVWMPFVSRAATHLRPGGRLALVLPWDFTYVAYARSLWAFLGNSFGSLRVVRVRDRLFPDISQDVLLLFADGKGRSTSTVRFEAHRSVATLVAESPESSATVQLSRVVAGERAFQEALLPDGLGEVLEAASKITQPARERVTFNIGYVSGHKQFFHPNGNFGLPADHLLPALTNARRLRGGGLYTSALPDEAQSVLWLPDAELDDAEALYERRGRGEQVHLRYKCSVRDPWYIVPGVKTPDLILSVFAQRPILMVNDGRHVASNSMLCGYLRAGEEADSVAAAWYNSLTLLNTELEVHSLGGGVLVLVPNEAGNVRIPKRRVVPKTILSPLATALRAGDLDAAYRAGDDALERRLGPEALKLIRRGVEVLENWRTARRGN
ncbi:hypothetical protein KMZ32_17910 [Phycicoccus sp. MAQZ13P-2]|uniref:Eco57I restriction-modification methylase domain-containing protein n=1 Tax=Phycicoccus mangrovi TaxID=2840470 RepID=UPI001C007134|nr:N-6 DNA methylase [Phycicoccus mangrovi]MBT9275954.1 hypothetical protein [Phycicoccus mangrovi]